MKASSIFSKGFLFLILSIHCFKGISQDLIFNMADVEKPYVLIQLKELEVHQDSVETAKAIKTVVEQVKAANAKLGYEPMVLKMASFILESNGKRTPYLTIRKFESFTDAEAYSFAIQKELSESIYGKIDKPFPISAGNYKICVEGNDFNGYYKFYTSSKK